MSVTRFDLVSEWHLDAPGARVWSELVAAERWPEWWRAVRRVERITDGGPDGIGAVRRFTWRTALPYDITFDMRSTRVEPEQILEGAATGELSGVGRWTLTPEGTGTLVRYDWQVELGSPWQRALAPLLRGIFAWNHNVVMGWGEADIRRRLGIG